MKDKENDENITCLIAGNLDYSSNKEITINEGIVSGEVNYTKYSVPSSILSNIGDCLIKIISSLIFVIVLYLLMKKLLPNFTEKLSKFTVKKLLVSLGIGLAVLIIVPILAVLLLITKVAAILGVLLILIYILLIISSIPLFTISIAKFIKSKMTKSSISAFVILIILTIVLAIIEYIPYFGFIFELIFSITAFGNLLISFKKEKEKQIDEMVDSQE